MDVLGGKWKGVVIWYLQDQTLRFSELKKRIVTISEKVLIRELRELEQAGLITRNVYAEVPPRVEYSLSEFGKSITTLMGEISKFGEVYGQRFGQVVEQPPQR
jgi:DNA-binding HxlR family transcriptional regulator